AAKFAPWPTSARHRGSENTTNENHDLYVVLPPGQNYTTSATDPALGKQVARTPVAPVAFASAQTTAIVPASADPLYRWDGRHGYPGDR
ncbi:hypothetical protein KJ590_00845, partial [Patescibacteria group bacterium]|nr:hypothetical protein [Patescibacteria group bacterium]